MADSEKKPTTPLPWIVLSGILGLFAVGTPAGNSNAPPKAGDKKEIVAAPEAANLIADNPIRPLVEFHSSRTEIPKPEELLSGDLHGYDKEFLIVTVPDPIDSPFGYLFDQVIDAVQRAVEKKNAYSLDRAWLPW